MKKARYSEIVVCLCFLCLFVGWLFPGNASSQTVTEFSSGLTAGSNPKGIAAGPDGNLWFTESTGNSIGKITPSGVITEFSNGLDADSYPWGITSGPDGNIWFTVNHGIGKIIPSSGSISVFSTGLADFSSPAEITRGADGNLWFTDYGTNAIGKITPSGVITEFSLGANSCPWGITAGSDGNIWFTDYGANAIGKITSSGEITEFYLSTSSGPWEITSGPDGNLWFTDYGANAIGRITPSGVITEFSSGLTAACGPWGIVSGPDGNLWFTEYNGVAIGKITPSGVISVFPTGLTANSDPQGITTGPDGNLWFTEYNAIGRLTNFRTVCTATLDKSLTLNIPYLSDIDSGSGSSLLWANLVYEYNAAYPSVTPFKLTTYSTMTDSSFSCTASTLYPDFSIIHIPDMLSSDGTTHLWVNLKYSPALSTKGNIYYVVKDYGVLSN